MTNPVNTNDPALRSWVESANADDTDFPIQNLPFGVFRVKGADDTPRIGVAIGDQIFDVHASAELGLLGGGDKELEADLGVARSTTLNALMARGRVATRALRDRVSMLLRREGDLAERARKLQGRVLVAQTDAEMFVPAHVGDYTDFYASVHHATNVGSMFRPDNPLLPNYKWIPIGYHGRASSIVISGTPIIRPKGQLKAPDADVPVFAPCRSLDYELEIGAYIAGKNPLGNTIPLSRAEDHLFGITLVNDWSARDIQSWEYQPLGPFLAKNFATTVAPWVVTLDALEPFRVPAYARPEGDPAPLPYLDGANDRARGGFDVQLEVQIATAKMRAEGKPAERVSRGNFSGMYWSLAQMLTHHASNGCSICPGDLIASGTVSNAEKESRGCLLERTWRGAEPLTFSNGETRKFLEDGDEVIMRGWCERDGARRIGLGECRGVIVAATP